MLDQVPDQVLICSQKNESQDLCPLYSNMQMRQFFGEDLVVNNDDKQDKKKRKPRNRKQKAKGLSKAIFQHIQNSLEGEDQPV